MGGGCALDGAERETEEEVRGRLPGGGVQRLVLLLYGDDPETGPGGLRACRHLNKAR